MARTKQVTPARRVNSNEAVQMQPLPDVPEKIATYNHSNGITSFTKMEHTPTTGSSSPVPPQAGLLQLIVCVGGIYGSFLTWGLLQERITTTPYPTTPNTFRPQSPSTENFKFPIFLNTIQSIFAFVSGSLYLLYKTSSFTIVPSKAAIAPLLLISLTTTLASPFGYASLSHVDYLTFVLAKSCKLLPVMFLHVAIFRKRYPLSKYLIVLAVTAGVATFTLYHPPKTNTKPSKLLSPPKPKTNSSLYGLILLGINLLFDGLTNTVQDHVFKSPTKYGKTTGPQMMVVQNLSATLLMSLYLFLTPYIPSSLLPASTTSIDEFSLAWSFLQRHPTVLYDVLGFAASGAIGQIFIFATLERFSSLLLVMVTVTRKMLTMVLSVVWYGKSLTRGQWVGVALVFGGIGTEAWIAAGEKRRKEKEMGKKRR